MNYEGFRTKDKAHKAIPDILCNKECPFVIVFFPWGHHYPMAIAFQSRKGSITGKEYQNHDSKYMP